MSYIGNNDLVKYEEDNWIELAEGFIKYNHYSPVISWVEYVAEQYSKMVEDRDESDSPFFEDDSKQIGE